MRQPPNPVNFKAKHIFGKIMEMLHNQNQIFEMLF